MWSRSSEVAYLKPFIFSIFQSVLLIYEKGFWLFIDCSATVWFGAGNKIKLILGQHLHLEEEEISITIPGGTASNSQFYLIIPILYSWQHLKCNCFKKWLFLSVHTNKYIFIILCYLCCFLHSPVEFSLWLSQTESPTRTVVRTVHSARCFSQLLWKGPWESKKPFRWRTAVALKAPLCFVYILTPLRWASLVKICRLHHSATICAIWCSLSPMSRLQREARLRVMFIKAALCLVEAVSLSSRAHFRGAGAHISAARSPPQPDTPPPPHS